MLQRNFDPPADAAEDPAAGGREWSRQPTVDLREMARILRRRWRLVAAPPLALAVLALIYVLCATTLYTATSTVLVDPRRSTAIEQNQAALSMSNFGTDDATIESETLLIQSVAILQRVVEKLKLTDDPEFVPAPGLLDPIKHLFSSSGPAAGASPAEAAKARAVEILQKRMKVTRQGTTFLVDIYVSSQSPRKAADIANAVAESYFEEQVRAKNDATRIASNWLNGQIDGLKSRVVAAERAVEDFRSANNLTVSQGVTVNDQQITDLNNQLIAARVQTAEARAKFDQAQQLNKSGNDPGGFSAAISSDIISKLRAQYADIAKNEADLSSKYGPRHPQVANVHAQLRDTQRLINEEIQRILQSARHDYDVARSREASLQQSFDQLQGVSSSSGQSQVRLRELQREAEANRTLYESYLARSKETTAQESLEMPDSHVVTKASIPIAPSWPKDMLILGLALTLGLGAGMRARLPRRLSRPARQDARTGRAISGVPALAAVPLVGARELARLAKRGRNELGRYDPRTTTLLPAIAAAALDALRDRGARHVLRRGDTRHSPRASAHHARSSDQGRAGDIGARERRQDHAGRQSRAVDRDAGHPHPADRRRPPQPAIDPRAVPACRHRPARSSRWIAPPRNRPSWSTAAPAFRSCRRPRSSRPTSSRN